MTTESLLLVEVRDLLDDLEDDIDHAGEEAVHLLSEGHLDAFLMDIYHHVGYLPYGHHGASQNIMEVLDTCPSYFPASGFTPLQINLWMKFAQHLATRFTEHRLYDAHYVNMFDYDRLHGDVLILIPHG